MTAMTHPGHRLITKWAKKRNTSTKPLPHVLICQKMGLTMDTIHRWMVVKQQQVLWSHLVHHRKYKSNKVKRVTEDSQTNSVMWLLCLSMTKLVKCINQMCLDFIRGTHLVQSHDRLVDGYNRLNSTNLRCLLTTVRYRHWWLSGCSQLRTFH